jgi:hypothetical protein
MPERQYSNDGRFFQQRHPVRIISQHRDQTVAREFTNLQEMLKKRSRRLESMTSSF